MIEKRRGAEGGRGKETNSKATGKKNQLQFQKTKHFLFGLGLFCFGFFLCVCLKKKKKRTLKNLKMSHENKKAIFN